MGVGVNYSLKYTLRNNSNLVGSISWLGWVLNLVGRWGLFWLGRAAAAYPPKYPPKEKGSIYSIIPIHIRTSIIPIYIKTMYYTKKSNIYKSYTKNYYWNYIMPYIRKNSIMPTSTWNNILYHS